MKGILLRLLGATFEVRVISHLTGKNLPGTRIGQPLKSWRKAKALFRKEAGKLKHGQTLRLQAVVVGKELMKHISDGDRHETLRNPPPIMTPEVEAHVPRETHDIEASNARQNEFMREHQDEPNVDVETEPDHVCDFAGEMVLLDGAYRPTCSTCGEPQ